MGDKHYNQFTYTENANISEYKLLQFLEAVSIGVFVIDAKTGYPYYANQKAQQLLGQGILPGAKTHELADVYKVYIENTDELYPPEKMPIVEALQGKTANVSNMEIQHEDKRIPIEVWGSPIFDQAGQVAYAVATFQDISERKQAEADRIELAQEKASKQLALRYGNEIKAKNIALTRLNQEKNEFLGIVAHDLKNPLSAIRGYAEEIQEYIDDMSKEEIVDFTQKICSISRQTTDLIVNLLDVNVIESGKINLSLANENVVNIAQNLVKNYIGHAKSKNISLNFHSAATEYHAFTDQHILRQVLDNLISNAVKYSPHGKNIYIQLSKNSDVIRCEIKDEGPGISQTEQQQLFGKFTRLTPKPTAGEHSTGLGLFIVKKLVEIIRGKVWCESELGKGTLFVVELPQ